MKCKSISWLILFCYIAFVFPNTAIADMTTQNYIMGKSKREMETLDRGFVVADTDNGAFLSWRLMDSEDTRFGSASEEVSFRIYKNNTYLTTVTEATNYLDTSGTSADSYSIVPVISGKEGKKSDATLVCETGTNYFDIPVERPEAVVCEGTTYERIVRDCSAGDLDGDGEYEIVVYWAANPLDNSVDGVTGTVLLAAYKLNGTKLWQIDLGPNIREGSHYTQFSVYDFDMDGKAEIACKTAPGSKDGKGNYVSSASIDENIIGTDNSAVYINEKGYIIEGDEFFTVFDGENGEAVDTIYYPFNRYPTSGWGKWSDNTNRVDRFLGTAAYVDGKKPSIIAVRGYYGRTTVAAINFTDGRLEVVRTFDTNVAGTQYEGQGNHNLSIADVDGDGKDEILLGSICLDDDFSVLWCSFRGHGDALHIGDYDPTNVGMEFFSVHEHGDETNYLGKQNDFGMTVYNASDGTELFHQSDTEDTARGMMADVGSGGYYQLWTSSETMSKFACFGNSTFSEVEIPDTRYVFRTFWDGDLNDELVDSIKLYSWNGEKMKVIFKAENCEKINGTKSNPALQADLFGDWREELVYPLSTYDALRVFTTTIPTRYKIKTLMHDSVYRMGIVSQQTGYNQPPHIGFYLSEEMFTSDSGLNFKTMNNSDYNADEYVRINEVFSVKSNPEYITDEGINMDKNNGVRIKITPLSDGKITVSLTGSAVMPEYENREGGEEEIAAETEIPVTAGNIYYLQGSATSTATVSDIRYTLNDFEPLRTPEPTPSPTPSPTPEPTPTSPPATVIMPIGIYADKIAIEKTAENSKVTFIVKPTETVDLSEIKLIVAEYDYDDKRLTKVKLGTNIVSDEKIIMSIDLPESEMYKIMIWDNKQVPLIKSITVKNGK